MKRSMDVAYANYFPLFWVSFRITGEDVMDHVADDSDKRFADPPVAAPSSQ